MAKLTGDDTSLNTDSTASTATSNKQQQEERQTKVDEEDKALQRARLNKERARAKLSTILHETQDESKGRSPNAKKTSFEDFTFPIPEKPQKKVSNEEVPPASNDTGLNPLSRRASTDDGNTEVPRHGVAIDVVSEDARSVMGEVELASQVGMSSSTESGHKYRVRLEAVKTQMRTGAAFTSSFVPQQQPTAARPTVEQLEARCVPKTYQAGGNRFRRINLWIEGTKSFQHMVSQGYGGSKLLPAKGKQQRQQKQHPTSAIVAAALRSPIAPGPQPSAGQRSHLDEELIVVNLGDDESGVEEDTTSVCESAGRFSCSTAPSSAAANAGMFTNHPVVVAATVARPAASSEQQLPQEETENFEDLEDFDYDDDGF